MASDNLPSMYHEFAPWFHLLTAPADYAEEAAVYTGFFVQASQRPPRTMLELGSGGGNNASHFKKQFECTLVDLSEDMLAISRELNPECEHQKGDMRTFRLGTTFDLVFVHDAVAYMTTADDLKAAMRTAFEHTRPGGVTIFVPDDTRERFKQTTDEGGHDGEDGRAMRYLEWTFDPDPNDSTYDVEYAYLLRDVDGTVRAAHDHHVCGLFSRNDWLEWLAEVGFVARREDFELTDDDDPGPYELFVAVRPE